MSDMTDHLFISTGMDYYVAGRYAVFAGLNPTAANLLHHAVEMALKGALAKKGMDLKARNGRPTISLGAAKKVPRCGACESRQRLHVAVPSPLGRKALAHSTRRGSPSPESL